MIPIYLDYNATTPVMREVADEMTPYLYQHFGNPSSSHSFGVATRRAVEEARARVASLLGATPAEIVFTSGGTESNNLAIKGAVLGNPDKGSHIITSAIEHPAVMEVCRWLSSQGYRLTILPVDRFGLVDPKELERTITSDTVLVSVMHANNEVGTIQPIREMAAIAHAHGALFHTDAAQSAGKLPVKAGELEVDLLSLAAHKFYGPKGVGALFVRDGVRLEPVLHGADHERGRRPGTENVVLIVGLGRACLEAARRLERRMASFQELRDQLFEGLKGALGDRILRLNGHQQKRLCNTLSVSFRGIDATTLLSEIGAQVAASAGAACHTGDSDRSPVLEAMDVPPEWAPGTVRFSVGDGTRPEDIDRAVNIVSEAVKRLSPEGLSSPVSLVTEDGRFRFTRFTHGLGCACKLRPQWLEEILAALPVPTAPEFLVTGATRDDAAVYRLDDRTAIVQSVDFFTPIVDDPVQFGAIAAANALSDLYAMGARPLFALGIVGFPSNRLPASVLQSILEGAVEKLGEAGIFLVGGHSIDDTEPKFGLAVTGVVHPDQVVRNDMARPGDALILTKPLGVGIIATAVKRGMASEEAARRAIAVMSELNLAAADAMRAVGVHACTDITGFGLLGHLREMCQASGVDAIISEASVPVLKSALEYAGAGIVPGGTISNLSFVESHVTFASNVSEVIRFVLADAQTSGGLLVSLPAERADAMLSALKDGGVTHAAHIGHIAGKGEGNIIVS